MNDAQRARFDGILERAVEDRDLQDLATIDAYFAEVYRRLHQHNGLDRHGVWEAFKISASGTNFAFRTVAMNFRMIESTMLPVVIPLGAAAAEIQELGKPWIPSGKLARALQRHVVLVPEPARRKLVACEKAAFAAPALRGDQFCVLTDMSLYHEDSGLWWEDAEYLTWEQSVI
mgnify:CR=1 FL=1